jgi:hypothetical protein
MPEFTRTPRTYYEVWVFNANLGKWRLFGRRVTIEGARDLSAEKSENHDTRICEVIEKAINMVDCD